MRDEVVGHERVHVHLLASATVERHQVWTADARRVALAEEPHLAYVPPEPT